MIQTQQSLSRPWKIVSSNWIMGNIVQLYETLTRTNDRSAPLSSVKIMVKEHYEIVRMEAYLGASVAQTPFEVQP